jgi:hypothetical protein
MIPLLRGLHAIEKRIIRFCAANTKDEETKIHQHQLNLDWHE